MKLTPTDRQTIGRMVADLTHMHIQLEVIRAKFAGNPEALAIAIAMVGIERADEALQELT